MKRYVGYILTGVLLLLFGVLSAILNFSPSNTLWALCWMAAALVTAWVTTFRNLKTAGTSEGKLPYILLIIPLTCGMFGLLLIVICALFGVIPLPPY